MKLVRMLLAAATITLVAACNANNPTSPDLPTPDRPLFDGGHLGSGG